jgi:hypothetical protein
MGVLGAYSMLACSKDVSESHPVGKTRP